MISLTVKSSYVTVAVSDIGQKRSHGPGYLACSSQRLAAIETLADKLYILPFVHI